MEHRHPAHTVKGPSHQTQNPAIIVIAVYFPNNFEDTVLFVKSVSNKCRKKSGEIEACLPKFISLLFQSQRWITLQEHIY